MNNKVLGSNFEQEFCQYLSSRGFWVHFITPAKDGGQPFDIIACKNNIVYAFDCKTNSTNRFKLSRIEFNQENAFTKFSKCGNRRSYFIIKKGNNIYKFDAMTLIKLKLNDIKSVVLDDGSLCKEQDFM